MTPTEAFDPNRDGGLDSLGPEPEEMDELSEPEMEELGATESGADSLAGEEAVGAKTPMDAMDSKKMEKLNEIKKKIQQGKLKGKKMDDALQELGFKKNEIDSLMNITSKGIYLYLIIYIKD